MATPQENKLIEHKLLLLQGRSGDKHREAQILSFQKKDSNSLFIAASCKSNIRFAFLRKELSKYRKHALLIALYQLAINIKQI